MNRAEVSDGTDKALLKQRVGAEIRRLRRRMGVTQMDAAAATFGTDGMQSHWSKWERGQVLPQVQNLEAIAKWAGVPMDVFGIDELMASPGTSDIDEAKALIRRALELLDGRKHE